PLQESSERSSVYALRARPTFYCTTTWERSTAHSARGDLCAVGPVRYPTPSPLPRAKLERRFVRKHRLRRSLSRMEKPRESLWRMVLSSEQRSSLRASTRD